MTRLKKALIALVAVVAFGLTTSTADARCARWGETGYHYYRSCWGPSFLYPHHRRCHNGLCWYH
jgi:hypothetical protein